MRGKLLSTLAGLLLVAFPGTRAWAATGAALLAQAQAGLPAVMSQDPVDRKLQQEIQKKINGERPNQGNIFDYITVTVRDRVAVLSGYAHDNSARDEAIDTARSQKGIESVVDNIQVLPVSGIDNRIRAAAIHNIFSLDAMGRYLADPYHPVRVIVDRGHLILEGKVMSEFDRNLAQVGANNTPGVFSVTNNLVVDPQLTNFD